MSRTNQRGFTMVEILLVVALSAIIGISVYGFVVSTSTNYFRLHEDGIRFSELSDKSQKMVRVLRGAGDITEATKDSLTAYAYFSPADQYYSVIRYYKNPTKTQLLADVTPMTANPPIGVPIPASKVTYTVLEDFYDNPAKPTFEYLDSAGNPYALPIADLHVIKGLRINLSTAKKSDVQTTKTDMTSQVTLRNRKTNL